MYRCKGHVSALGHAVSNHDLFFFGKETRWQSPKNRIEMILQFFKSSRYMRQLRIVTLQIDRPSNERGNEISHFFYNVPESRLKKQFSCRVFQFRFRIDSKSFYVMFIGNKTVKTIRSRPPTRFSGSFKDTVIFGFSLSVSRFWIFLKSELWTCEFLISCTMATTLLRKFSKLSCLKISFTMRCKRCDTQP